MSGLGRPAEDGEARTLVGAIVGLLRWRARASGRARLRGAGTAGERTPRRSWRHVALLWSACLTTTGAYYAKDVLAAVSPQLMQAFGMSKAQYGALYGLLAIPNIFASVLGGALVDVIGSGT